MEGGFDTAAVLRGAGIGAVWSAGLLLLATLMLYMSSQPTAMVPWAAMGIAWLSVFVGGFSAARRAGRAGLWHGAAAGLALFLGLYLVGVLGFDAHVTLGPGAVRALVAGIVGALGGALGLAL
ncbi:MAG: TIGR04086 family membrane protein [Thermaerobacter sp.]|nr:TIGR04086 family membrane protein [Thermaerobacter sp.]